MHISKIIEYVKNEINFSQEFCEDNVFVTIRTEAILRLIENLEQSHKNILEITKENEQKDKQIDLMVEWIEKHTKYYDEDGCYCEVEKEICEKDIECKDCIKQHFEKLAKEKGE